MKFFLLLMLAFLMACTQQERFVQCNEEIVFDTSLVQRYKFPTHFNDLLIDRAESSFSEVFFVIIEPGKSVHHHKHTDTEQIFYMLEGSGILSIGVNKKEYPVKAGNVVRIPVNTLHSIRTDSTNQLIRYLCVDCFGTKPMEPSWDEHVKVVCRENGYNYAEVAGIEK